MHTKWKRAPRSTGQKFLQYPNLKRCSANLRRVSDFSNALPTKGCRHAHSKPKCGNLVVKPTRSKSFSTRLLSASSSFLLPAQVSVLKRRLFKKMQSLLCKFHHYAVLFFSTVNQCMRCGCFGLIERRR